MLSCFGLPDWTQFTKSVLPTWDTGVAMITTHWKLYSARQVWQLSAHEYCTTLLNKMAIYKIPSLLTHSDSLRSILEDWSLSAANRVFCVISEVCINTVSTCITWLEKFSTFLSIRMVWKVKSGLCWGLWSLPICVQRTNRNKDDSCSMVIQLSLYLMIL